MKKCKGCGRYDNEPLGLNKKGEPYLACCPNNDYVEIPAVEWLVNQVNSDCLTSAFIEPKLKGIENNNDWISIKENGLPKEKGNYWLFETNKEIRLGMFWMGVFDNEYPIEVTHYQLIQKPLQPLY